MSMRTSFTSWWTAAAVLSFSAAAAAQQAKTFAECTRSPSESDVSAAKGAFEAGQVSFQEADYDRAILYWEDAFRRDCTALPLLLNLARAYELSGQKDYAVSALETYLERRPNATDRDQITRRIEVLQGQIDEERAEAAPPPEPTTPPADEQLTPAPTTVADEGVGTAPPIWPLVVAGSGVAVGVVGAVLWGTNQATINRCTEASPGEYVCPSDDATRDAQAAQPRRNAGMGLTIGGAALAVGGVVTYFVLKSQARQNATLAPSVGPGFAGLTYAGAF